MTTTIEMHQEQQYLDNQTYKHLEKENLHIEVEPLTVLIPLFEENMREDIHSKEPTPSTPKVTSLKMLKKSF